MANEKDQEQEKVNAEQVRAILRKAMPPDGGPADALGGLMLDFIGRLCEVESKVEKVGKFCAFSKEKLKAHDERIGKIETLAAAPEAPAEAEAAAEDEGMVEPGAHGMPVGTAAPTQAPVEPAANGAGK